MTAIPVIVIFGKSAEGKTFRREIDLRLVSTMTQSQFVEEVNKTAAVNVTWDFSRTVLEWVSQ